MSITLQTYAQFSTRKVKSKHEQYTDSLKAVKYDKMFPFLGQQTYRKGFDIPYPMGIMANYMWMEQGITIDNLQLGLKTNNLDIPLTPVDFIKFGDNKNTSYSVNVRPDLWVFPFINLYGIFGAGRSKTEVNLVAPVELKSVVDQRISTAGVGVMAAFGIGPVWLSADINWTWNKPELLDKAVRVNVLGVRLGHTFVFKEHPYQNIAIWVGGMRAEMNSETNGEVKMINALPPETWERKDEIVDNYWSWYDNDATIPQKKVADKVLTPIVDRLDAADGSSVIRYAMDKQVKELWNGLIGVQYQYNKHWMIRSEGGIIGDRKSFLISLNYRFLGWRKIG
jgi:hypothetical protein